MGINDINDIILIGNIINNSKLRKMMSELFKEQNKIIYNKLIDKSNENKYQNFIIKGATLHCFNKSISFPKYRITDIIPFSIGIENYKHEIDFLIKKGECIPIRLNKYIKIKKDLNNIHIRLYEGENKNVRNNKLITNINVDINNLINVKREEKYIEILIQFIMDSNFNISLYILDRNSYKRQLEYNI